MIVLLSFGSDNGSSDLNKGLFLSSGLELGSGLEKDQKLLWRRTFSPS